MDQVEVLTSLQLPPDQWALQGGGWGKQSKEVNEAKPCLNSPRGSVWKHHVKVRVGKQMPETLQAKQMG